MNPIYKLRHKIQMLKDFLQLLSTGPVTHMGSPSLKCIVFDGDLLFIVVLISILTILLIPLTFDIWGGITSAAIWSDDKK